ncbi:amino acid ABC transporter substrate-binding protein [Streptomyces sulfonofaciens]|uniref:Amino acid ABC transporter substrate-binding protein n=1 Tax=Streptomyces sulfonofaciens TaxID=68272 RepID=A0A919GIH7_9ACTN|nr:ABC transporter substrate-binding protein [Streptomyces sulfonofaciens]GHH84734.1 amino acid ABC transporter substrate-binding protein [Streptomyces sulfonofaciens]
MHFAARTSLPALLAGLLVALAACAPEPDASDGAAGKETSAASAASCARSSLATKTGGRLTVGTDKPAYEPWFQDDRPANGKGFESAVAYAVARSLGFARSQVVWQTVPFNNAYAPGRKTFDFDINQVSISDARRRAVDFSSGYYTVRQAVVTLKKSRFAHVTTVAGLKDARIGAQVGTTSLDTVDDLIKPVHRPAVFQKSDYVKEALRNGQVDAVVLDLPTAFYITSAEVPEATITGQFGDTSGKAEQFGLVLDRSSPLTSCVTRAVDGLRKDGTLAALEKKWLSDAASVPVLK